MTKGADGIRNDHGCDEAVEAEIICQGCGKSRKIENWHFEHPGGGITHTCSCGYGLASGTFGASYGTIKECPRCNPGLDAVNLD